MEMKRCPICGEKYSITYRDCPFCEEEEALREGKEIRRNIHKGKRVAHGGRRFSLITSTLIILIVIMAGLLIYLLRDNDDTAKDQTEKPPVEEVAPDDSTEVPEPDVGTETGSPEDGADGTMPEDSGDETTVPDVPVDSTSSDYATMAKLPDGLSLSKEDFTLRELGETHTLQASGGGSTYKWYSEDDGIASVDQNGKVIAVSGGITNVLVTDGNKKAVCIVRVSASGTLTTTPDDSSQSSGSVLKAGDAVVINGGNGVRVRSGPSTNHEILATVPNGADVKVVKSAGDGWYEITFDHTGGARTTGYMKGDFLKNT